MAHPKMAEPPSSDFRVVLMSAREDESPLDKSKPHSAAAETTLELVTPAAKLPAGDPQETEADFESPASLARSATSARFSSHQVIASRFRILRFIGQGGMGEVYEAEDLELREHVALKTIRQEIARDEHALERFKREIQLARKVTHPGVCRVFDVFRDRTSEGETIFLSMELLAGETLAERLKRSGRMSMGEAFPLVCQMAAALGAAHEVGIVHRDFKTGNVMLVPATQNREPVASCQEVTAAPVEAATRPRTVVTDFGLARSAVGIEDAATKLSATVGIVGTPAYMAPEQVEGGEVSPAADIYALGVVMYEMITGQQPFIADTPLATAVKRLKESPPAPREFVPDLDPQWERVILRCLERHPADRFASASDVVKALTGEAVEVGRRQIEQKRKRRLALSAATAGVVLAALTAGSYFYFHRAPKLTEKDTIVLADFTNTTGDPVFDGALRQGLSVQLKQSPFLSLISDPRIHQTLRQMGQPADAKLTPQIAREICERTASAAIVEGSIAVLGKQYVLGLTAVNCRTGDSLAEEQERATGKEQVLAAIDKAAAKMRGKLGESLSTVQKFNTPLLQATTSSLEALKAWSLSSTSSGTRTSGEAIPLLKRAIELDPNFALAYAWLAGDYLNLGERNLAIENTKKAYELRDRLSESEKLTIESQYYYIVTGDLEQAREAYEVLAQSYPRDDAARSNLGLIYQQLGQYDKNLTEMRESLRLAPKDPVSYSNLVSAYLYLNRVDDARATANEALSKILDSPDLRFQLYGLAFLENDPAGMAQQVAWSVGKPGVEDVLLAVEADTAAYSGRLAKGRVFSSRGVASAEQVKESEAAAGFEAEAAVREALFGNAAQARHRAAAALNLSTGRDVQYGAALALAMAGDEVRARSLAEDMAKRFPEDTIAQFNYLSTIRAQLAINRNDPSKAIEALRGAAAYDLGMPSVGVAFPAALYPIYLRGEAYLAADQGGAAAGEFQEILDHRGLVQNEPIGALAHLDLGRAYAMVGESEKARAAYNDFLTLWKDADPDIPVLRRAKAEFAKLKSTPTSSTQH
ncbi:MAG: serine/threonine-protein kinase [Candidatus Acidiferrales bacterium]